MTTPISITEILSAHCRARHPSLPSEHKTFDFGAALASDLPLVLVGAPAPESILVIAEDGTGCLIERDAPCKDFDGLVVPGDMPLRHALAQEQFYDLRRTIQKIGATTIALWPTPREGFVLLGVSAGARRLFGHTEDTAIEVIAQQAIDTGGSDSAIRVPFEEINATLEEPLFNPVDTGGWDADQAREVEDIIVDILLSCPSFEGGEVELRARHEDANEDLLIDQEWNQDVEDYAIALLDALVDLENRFVGTTWDYTDGAINRESGYCPSGKIIFTGEIASPTAHERMAALGRLRDRLAATSLSAEEISDLFA